MRYNRDNKKVNFKYYMATTNIDINKLTVEQFLSTGKEHLFIIPEYQRPYAWDEEQIQTLFSDLKDFAERDMSKNDKQMYFLGCIVSYINSNDEQEVIDGQQRITSLMLLLRALYNKFSNSSDKRAQNFSSVISPCIWKKDDISGEVNYDHILIESRVMNNDGNEVLRNILRDGKADPKAKDNYSKNFIILEKLINEYSTDDPSMMYSFANAILRRSILLPISADSQDTALTIFSTLNNRGKSLSDADIFKANIYSTLGDEKRKEFIQKWQDLEDAVSDIEGEDIQKLFGYYAYYQRAINKDVSTSTPSVRDYYTKINKDALLSPDLLDNLAVIAQLWRVAFNHKELEGEPWTKNAKILQVLDCLSSYPNEFWKYPVIAYYLQNRKKSGFEKAFLKFLRYLFMELFANYALHPSIVYVKSSVMNLNVNIIHCDGLYPAFSFKDVDLDELKDRLYLPHNRVLKMLLKLMAYDRQDTLLPEKWEIEHIFPQKWQSNYVISETSEAMKEKIEHIGNKIPFEKKLNIVAGNEYYAKKKAEYLKSSIQIVRDLGESSKDDWSPDDIIRRDGEIVDHVVDIFNDWSGRYNENDATSPKQSSLTPEQIQKALELAAQGKL